VYEKASSHLQETGGMSVSGRQIQRVVQRFGAAAGPINDWCAMATSPGVVLKRWRFTCSWSPWQYCESHQERRGALPQIYEFRSPYLFGGSVCHTKMRRKNAKKSIGETAANCTTLS
jgi:hypothetical protein